jgi:hypothetical protein
MRIRHVPVLIALVIAVAALLGAAIAGPVGATPSRSTVCTDCHSGAASGTVTATPSTSTPAAGAAYTVAINIGLTASGNTGYHIASTDAAGTATTWTTVSSTIGSQTSWTANMTAPATAGTYYYKVWCAKGPNDATGMAKAALYSITVPAPIPTAAITSLTPNHAQTGASVVIAGTNLGSGGTVRFDTTVATTTVWSTTSVTATVPAGLAAGATTVTVTPTGGAASNAAAFTVDAPPAPKDTTAPTTAASGVSADGWCNGAIAVTLTATDEAGGSGVASIAYRVDGRAPVTVDGPNTTVDLDAIYLGDAVGMQGTHTIAYHATDVAGNVEPSRTLTVHHDSSRPTTRAPRAAAVRRNHTAALKYEVRDAAPNAGTGTVVIVIKNRHGKVVKRLHLGTRPVNTALTARFTCKLRAGTYRFSVQATDAAGNTQAKAASQRLTVRPAIGS